MNRVWPKPADQLYRDVGKLSASAISGILLQHVDVFGILYATYIPSEGFQRFSGRPRARPLFRGRARTLDARFRR